MIDDDYRMRNQVKMIFRQQPGHEVTAAVEGRFGMAQAVANRPDLILLASELPDVDGHEVCRQLKANPHTRAIPVIMLSRHGASADVTRAYQSGGNDYIIKPLVSTILLAKVASHLASGAGRRRQLVPASGESATSVSTLPAACAA